MQGTLKWFNRDRGFGFVTADSGDDVFIHCRDIAGYGSAVLLEGDRVEFEVKIGPKGPRCINAKFF